MSFNPDFSFRSYIKENIFFSKQILGYKYTQHHIRFVISYVEFLNHKLSGFLFLLMDRKE